jgi:hypothetical protein
MSDTHVQTNKIQFKPDLAFFHVHTISHTSKADFFFSDIRSVMRHEKLLIRILLNMEMSVHARLYVLFSVSSNVIRL